MDIDPVDRAKFPRFRIHATPSTSKEDKGRWPCRVVAESRCLRQRRRQRNMLRNEPKLETHVGETSGQSAWKKKVKSW